MTKKEQIIQIIHETNASLSAKELGVKLSIDRSTTSRYLNQLCAEGKLEKTSGRPVYYRLKANTLKNSNKDDNKSDIDFLIGAKYSLQVAIQKAKAAILYPPRGLHTLILGETGVGKSMFAKLMFDYAKETNMIDKEASFIRFNCADYSENPQLLISQIFGVKKGAYTGADKDKNGLLKKADGGILFLDEVHRLSPQGQEMLFTFIDSEEFRKLGETEKIETAKVQIIAATTEDPTSYLLKTFTRRIPMTITIPPLRERTVKERYNLIEKFIIDESKRVNKSIYINKNAIISILLYDCLNNIGQLKSDIQLSCAKAFLNYKYKEKDYILVNNSDLPVHVKMGVMNIKENRNEVNSLLKSKDDIIRFSYKEFSEELLVSDEEDFIYYNEIEDKVNHLKQKGLKSDEIKNILDIDIEKHFKNYIVDFSIKKKREEIEKIVHKDILEIAEYVLNYARKKLEKDYDEKTFYAFSLHLDSSIERIRNGAKIYHPKLNSVRKKFKKEFLVAMEIAKYIEDKFEIDISLDEIGYITMFIASNPYEVTKENNDRVSVILMMHGSTTATSMMNVANTLVGTNHGIAIDMPLSMDVKVMYELLKNKILNLNSTSKGILFLVDMGSLVNFADMIKEELSIDIKTIDKASTPLVIEALRKATLGRELTEIYSTCAYKNINSNGETIHLSKSKIIVSVCFTGEGASKKIKSILEKNIKDKNIKVMTLNILDKHEFKNSLEKIKRENEILAVVSTIDIDSKEIPFIPAIDYFAGKGKEKLDKILKKEEMIDSISESLKEHIEVVNAKELVILVKSFIGSLLFHVSISITTEVFTGILLHICFLIDKKVKNEITKEFENVGNFIEENKEKYSVINGEIMTIEQKYDIRLTKSEKAYILYMIIQNSN
ncbi:sigma-54-dependent transcriptional regulator [Helicovermis profundi]|uniref:Sigma-54-dependent transcriptional regulator n=1 Tax=Helicovermis profundi TaxID=3065157 RepID=A0AAU9E510_9FIRM|nr:sigma-54-dependent transcriptional regulator [Clostridia bacterium S502]